MFRFTMLETIDSNAEGNLKIQIDASLLKETCDLPNLILTCEDGTETTVCFTERFYTTVCCLKQGRYVVRLSNSNILFQCEEGLLEAIKVEVEETSELCLQLVESKCDVCFSLQKGEETCCQLSICLTNERNQTKTLTFDEDGCACFRDCEKGCYTISTSEDVILCKDGEEIGNTLLLEEETTQIQVFTCNPHTSLLTLKGFVRKQGNELLCPSIDMSFHLQVHTEWESFTICLNEENEFCEQIEVEQNSLVQIQSCDEGVWFLTGGLHQEHKLECCIKEDTQVCVVKECEETCLFPSSLRIQKKIRTADGKLVRPKNEECFQVSVKRLGSCDTYLLHASNNFTLDLFNVCAGIYEVQELLDEDYETSYRIDGACEKSYARFEVCEHECHEVIIVNERKVKGSVTVSKYIRNACNELMEPQDDESFEIVLSSYFMKECFILNKDNNWCLCFSNLSKGSYEIRERSCNDYDVTYSIDSEKEKQHARFTIDGQQERDIKVINTQRNEQAGVLKISVMEETANNEVVKPASDEVFEVEVESEDGCERYCLHMENNWCVYLDGLSRQTYCVRMAKEEMNFIRTINGCVSDDPCICMGQQAQSIRFLHQRLFSGTLTIDLRLVDCSEENVEIPKGMEFEILVEGREFKEIFVLKESNHYCVVLNHLPKTALRIIQKDNFGYEVNYEVNCERVRFASLVMNEEDQCVSIINKMISSSGNLLVEACFSEDCEVAQEIPFVLKGRGVHQTYVLCEANQYATCFDDLAQGCYQILCEEDCQIEAQGQCLNDGKFTLGEDDYSVQLFVPCQQEPSLCISKRMIVNHNQVMPDDDAYFDFLFTGKGIHEVYRLHSGNQFTVYLYGLDIQHYEIKELKNKDRVEYEVDGCIQQDGYFYYEGKDQQVVLINHERQERAVEIRKYMRDFSGCLVMPQRYECFEVLLEGYHYKQTFILNKENNFMLQIYGLEEGHYQISELTSGYLPAFYVQDCPCESGEFDITEEDVLIEIVNSECPRGSITLHGLIQYDQSVQMPSCEDCFEVFVSSEEGCETIVLDEQNDFSYTLCDTCARFYTLKKEGAVFAIGNECYTDAIEVETHGEDLEIDVIMPQYEVQELCIKKVMVDEGGNRRQPDEDHCFNFRLYHDQDWNDFTLSKENQFRICFHELPLGTYELQELNDCEVMYEINQKKQQAHGRFDLGEEPIEICVLNQEEGRCSLHLCAKGEQEQLDTPIHVQLYGQSVHQQLCLSEENGFELTLHQLEKGMYELRYDCEAKCIINEKEDTRLLLEQDSEVVFLLPRKKCASISVMWDCDGMEKQPHTITFANEQESKTINLSMEDDNCINFELPCGEYQIQGNHSSYDMEMNGQRIGDEWVCFEEERYHIVYHTKKQKRGSIELSILLKNEDGSYGYPQIDEVFHVLVRGNCYEECFELNGGNQFYVSLRNLEDGWYEVAEQTRSDACYIVNHKEATQQGFVMVKHNQNTVKIIVPKKSRTLKLCKFIRTEDGLQVPKMGMYRIHVSKSGWNEVIELNEQNQYCMVLEDLEEGMYVVDELDHECVSYIVDGQSECRYAIVTVKNEHQVWIINEEEQLGSIHVQKKLRTAQGELVLPEGDFRALLHVSKAGFNEQYPLNHENQWQVDIGPLEAGIYVLDEVGDDRKVSFIVDGQSETKYGVVQVDGNRHHVDMINQVETTSQLSIEKRIADAQGQLHLPMQDDVFQVELWREDEVRRITLSQENEWNVVLSDIMEGVYRIVEVSNQGYRVQYQIDDRPWNDQAIIRIDGQSHHVTIINTMSANVAYLRIGKWILNGDGTTIRPAEGDRYTVEIIGMEQHERVELSYENRFETVVPLRKEGSYRVEEIGGEDFVVTYSINGLPPQDSGDVEVHFGEENKVDIYNERSSNANSVQIVKYMLNAQGEYVKPSAQESFTFVLRYHDQQTEYVLNEQNDWTIQLNQLATGIYSIEETSSPYEVKYLVNSPEFSEQATFEVAAGSELIIGIINVLPSLDLASLTIRKEMIVQGESEMPSREDSFEVWVSSPGYSQVITLDFNNQFQYQLSNLAEGIYHVEELQAKPETITYVVDGGSPTSVAQLKIQDNRSHEVRIQNHVRETVKKVQSVQFIIE